MMNWQRSRTVQRGLSLLELLVAVSIMALAVGVLYRVLGSSVRTAGLLEQQQRATLIVQSLLAAKDAVAEEGWNETGESAGYNWQVRSRPYDTSVSREFPGAARLHAIEIEVSWGDGGQTRQVQVQALRPQRRPVMVPSRGNS